MTDMMQKLVYEDAGVHYISSSPSERMRCVYLVDGLKKPKLKFDGVFSINIATSLNGVSVMISEAQFSFAHATLGPCLGPYYWITVISEGVKYDIYALHLFDETLIEILDGRQNMPNI